MASIDWNALLHPSISLIEIFIRGTVIYLLIFLILRIFRRGGGGSTIADVLLIVLIADASQNAMTSEYRSITEGALLIATLAFWDWFLNWAAFNSSFIGKVLSPVPMLLVKDGAVIEDNMKKEMVSLDELLSQLRQAGTERVEDVRLCCLENNGKFSVVRK